MHIIYISLQCHDTTFVYVNRNKQLAMFPVVSTYHHGSRHFVLDTIFFSFMCILVRVTLDISGSFIENQWGPGNTKDNLTGMCVNNATLKHAKCFLVFISYPWR